MSALSSTTRTSAPEGTVVPGREVSSSQLAASPRAASDGLTAREPASTTSGAP
jgi:hypothetical protein